MAQNLSKASIILHTFGVQVVSIAVHFLAFG